jgi:AhpC/TSA antioxidant enzyme
MKNGQNCQEYIRTLTASITPDALLALPTPTFICIIGHGSPSLIPMYTAQTGCPFPIYADPTKKLYNALGMLRTLNLGSRPEYQRRALGSLMLNSFVQSLKQLPFGKTFQGGDYQQVGGEFMFEPASGEMYTPITSPEEEDKQLGGEAKKGVEGMLESGYVEEKRVTWCHRMRNTRDHAEMEEVREVLGLDAVEVGRKEKRRSKKVERKGTGFSLGSRTSTGLSKKLTDLEDGGSSGRQSSEKLMDATNVVH